MLTVRTDDLKDALQLARKATGSNHITDHVLLEQVGGEHLRLVATDLDTTVVTTCPCEGDAEPVGLEADQLYDVARRLDGELEIEIEDDWWATVQGPGDVDARVPGIPKSDFPEVPEATEPSVRLEGDGVARMVERTGHAISNDDARANLCGAHLQATDDDQIRAEATDGHRLSWHAEPLDGSREEWMDDGVIVPEKSWSLVGDLAAEGQDIGIGYDADESTVHFHAGGTRVSSREINGTFPDVTQVLPDDDSDPMVADRQQLLDGVEFVALFASTKTHHMRLTATDGRLELYASDPDRGEGQRAVPVDYEVDDEQKVGLNYNYLEDALKALPSDDEVAVQIIDTLSPITVTAPGDDDTFHVVMPMRL